MKVSFLPEGTVRRPGFVVSAIPIILLLGSLISIIIFEGSGAIADYSHLALLGAATVAMVLSVCTGTL
ncbi:MAG: hypothetical protein NC131_13390, partial [Roseburia sp.]|nr:hypothetical protein [Roseburia sp.]